METKHHALFVSAIHGTNSIELTFNSMEKGIITRKVIPTDYGPSRRFPNLIEKRYHVIDLESPTGKNHPIPILEAQIIEIKILNEKFDPATFVTWKPNWYISRNWGMYS